MAHRHGVRATTARQHCLLDKNRELSQTIASLNLTILALPAEIQKLKRPRKTPRNSSVPPSTTPPHAKPQSSRQPTGKSPGGQPGHPQHARALLPVEQCDEVIQLTPEVCRRCGAPLDQHQCLFDPLRHQVWDIPEIKPLVIEYRRERFLCEKCQETTCAPLPETLGSTTAGPKLLATTAIFLSRLRGSRRLRGCPKSRIRLNDGIFGACSGFCSIVVLSGRCARGESPEHQIDIGDLNHRRAG